MSRAWRGGSTRAWRRVRPYVLARDGATCRKPKGDGICGAPATTAGHIIPRCDGGTDDPANLRAECAACNYAGGAELANRNRPPVRPNLWSW